MTLTELRREYHDAVVALDEAVDRRDLALRRYAAALRRRRADVEETPRKERCSICSRPDCDEPNGKH